MKHLTQDRPKPLVEVSGVPLIDHALNLVEDLPAQKCVVNLHYKAEMLQVHLAGKDVATLVEHPQILDTGGGLRNALSLLGSDPVMTLNPDAIWGGGNPLSQLANAWRPEVMDGLLMCVSKQHALGHKGTGDFLRDGDGRLSRGDGLIYGGAQILKTERLHEIGDPVFSLNRLWDLMIAENRLYAVEYDADWCDVGHPEGISLADTLFRSRNV